MKMRRQSMWRNGARSKTSGNPAGQNEVRSLRARAVRAVVVLAAFVVAGVVPSVFDDNQAHAATAQACGTVLVSGAQWLGGAGVDVHSNGWAQSTGSSCASSYSTSSPSVQDGWAWQCVELPARLYAVKGWGTVHGNASQIPGDAGLVAHPNGSGYRPVPGDLLIEGATSYEPYGHVAVVDSIAGLTIHAVEENASVTGRHDYLLSGSTVIGGYAPVVDVMHSPANHYTVDVGVVLRHTGVGGYALHADGSVAPFGGAPSLATSAEWPGQDIARGLVLRSDDRGGYVLDLYGGIHPFGNAPAMAGGPYWGGWDIARGIVLRPDNAGGYVLDGWGGIHPFGDAPAMAGGGYWAGWDIARGIALLGNGSGGYVLDGWGGVHPFGSANAMSTTAYWSNWDVARGIAIDYSGSSGIVVDDLNGLHSIVVERPPCHGCI